ncbi:MAG: von Willebrand factor type A domain-containing protein [Acidobacteria bacterium]|nr:von Willebrand factor type A domain-containing protein [Acidobacteriota bacterium]
MRVEEFLNYFHYKLPTPEGNTALRIHTELGPCPWNGDHQLLFTGLRTKELSAGDMPPANLVFLIDVSGSMMDANKLPLLKQSFRLLVEQLRPQDRVSIAYYASGTGVALEATPGSAKGKILDAIQALHAGGSTNGAGGIRLAYSLAAKSYIPKGNNRVILATDGDFNAGVSSDGELVRLIEEKRKSGIFLTVLGYGMGNLKDSNLEQLADAGNGNYAYIDSILEARKFLVKEMGRNLLTVAKDVKLQVEFNPEHISEYRLIGYENRLLNPEDFKDDKKDAGELGSGHTVVALYELVPAGTPGVAERADRLRYQTAAKSVKKKREEAAFVKARYKAWDEDSSKEISVPVEADRAVPHLARASDDFRFAAAVAEFAMILSESKWKGKSDYGRAMSLAESALGDGSDEERRGLLELMKAAKAAKARASR